MLERFERVLYGVTADIGATLSRVSKSIKIRTEEIRLRSGLPLALTVGGETLFVKKDGQTSCCLDEDNFIVSKDDLDECFRRLCNNSAFAREEELKNGYLRLKNGCRAGIFGTLSNGFMQDITAINIRIAREIKGAAVPLVKGFSGEGILIAGSPGSGKTTVLRDLIRLISRGESGKLYRVAVIDSRGEIGGDGNDLGPNTDIIRTEDKAKGMEIGLRTMFPQIIAFDEIGTLEELRQIKESFNAGVSIITTAHIGQKEELLERQLTRELLLSGAVKRVAVLPKDYHKKFEIYKTGELLNGSV